MQAKIDKFKFFLDDCDQIHYQIGFMGQFVRIICNTLYFYYTAALWPFISKVMTWVQLWCIIREASNNRQFPIFSFCCYQIHYQIGYMGQFVHIISNPLYWYYTEASWPFISKVGAFECMVHKLVSKQKSTNSVFFLMIVTKYITR